MTTIIKCIKFVSALVYFLLACFCYFSLMAVQDNFNSFFLGSDWNLFSTVFALYILFYSIINNGLKYYYCISRNTKHIIVEKFIIIDLCYFIAYLSLSVIYSTICVFTVGWQSLLVFLFSLGISLILNLFDVTFLIKKGFAKTTRKHKWLIIAFSQNVVLMILATFFEFWYFLIPKQNVPLLLIVSLIISLINLILSVAITIKKNICTFDFLLIIINSILIRVGYICVFIIAIFDQYLMFAICMSLPCLIGSIIGCTITKIRLKRQNIVP